MSDDWEYVRLVKLRTTDEVVCSICLSSDLEMALPKMLRCSHVFCFCCFAKWFLSCKQSCPVCHQSVCPKDLKTVVVERESLQSGTQMQFVLVRKNLKNNKIEVLENDGSAVGFQRSASISVSAFEKMVFQEVEEMHSVQVTDKAIIDFCQFVSLQSISGPSLMDCPQFLGKRKTNAENQTLKEDFSYFYQNAKGFSVFVHPVDFNELQFATGKPESLWTPKQP